MQFIRTAALRKQIAEITEIQARLYAACEMKHLINMYHI